MKERETNPWLSVGAYARRWGLTRATVTRWLRRGALDGWRYRGVVRIRNQPPGTKITPSSGARR